MKTKRCRCPGCNRLVDDFYWEDWQGLCDMHYSQAKAIEMALNNKAMQEKMDFLGITDPPVNVYFISAESGPVKIGFTNNVPFRLETLQIANHETLKVEATFEGSPSDESYLHKTFAEHQIRGEWFKPHCTIINLIDLVKAGGNRHTVYSYTKGLKRSDQSATLPLKPA